jgi:hypothetical protein
VSYAREREYLLLTRLLLGRHEPDRALSLLDRLEALAGSQGRVQSMIEMRALRALAMQSSGEHDDALSTLGAALRCPAGGVHPRLRR